MKQERTKWNDMQEMVKCVSEVGYSSARNDGCSFLGEKQGFRLQAITT